MRERINAALKAAMKDREQQRVCTLRLINAALNEREIASRSGDDRPEIDESESLDVLTRMVKQREESAKAYDEGGRPELAQQERSEIRIIREFMPKPLAPEEVKAAVQAAIRDSEANSIKDMGRVMGVLKAKYQGRMDFGQAGAAVKDMLA